MPAGGVGSDLTWADNGPGEKENKGIKEKKAGEGEVPGVEVPDPALDAESIITDDEQSCKDYDT